MQLRGSPNGTTNQPSHGNMKDRQSWNPGVRLVVSPPLTPDYSTEAEEKQHSTVLAQKNRHTGQWHRKQELDVRPWKYCCLSSHKESKKKKKKKKQKQKKKNPPKKKKSIFKKWGGEKSKEVCG